MISPATDEQLHDWLRWAEENGSSFLKRRPMPRCWPT